MHNAASGNCGCIMSYTNCYSWSLNDHTGVVVCTPVPRLPMGNIFCSSRDGTDINEDNKHFDFADNGNCLSQIIMK
jgi:hypothetical protein